MLVSLIFFSLIVCRYVLWLLRRRFDAEEAPLLAAETDPARRAYLDERAALGSRNQSALWSADVFTDGAAMRVVGSARAARVLVARGQLLDDIWLITAGPAKRMISITIKRLGVSVNTYFAN